MLSVVLIVYLCVTCFSIIGSIVIVVVVDDGFNNGDDHVVSD